MSVEALPPASARIAPRGEDAGRDPFAPGNLVVAAPEETRFFEATVVSATELDVTVEEETGNDHKRSVTLPRAQVWPVRAVDAIEPKVGDAFVCRTATREWKPCIVRAVEVGFCVFDVLDAFFEHMNAKRLDVASIVLPSPAIRDAIHTLSKTIQVGSDKKSRANALEVEGKGMSPMRPPKWKPSAMGLVLVRTFWGWVPAKVTRVESEVVELALESGGVEMVTNGDLLAPLPTKKSRLQVGATVVFRAKGKARSAPWDWVWPYARVIAISADTVDIEDRDEQRHSVGREDVLPLEK